MYINISPLLGLLRETLRCEYIEKTLSKEGPEQGSQMGKDESTKTEKVIGS